MKKYIALAALLFTATMTRAQLVVEAPNPLTKFRMAQMAVSNLYVDKVDDNKLVEDAIRGMLKELDPHSVYSTPDEVKALTEPLQGNFEGIGVQFNVVEDTLMVIQPVTNGPSERVGIVAGDRIVSVNDSAIAGVKMKKEDIMLQRWQINIMRKRWFWFLLTRLLDLQMSWVQQNVLRKLSSNILLQRAKPNTPQ